MNAHFFDFNTLVTINSKVWIVDRKDPNTPIIRIPKSEFNLLKNGVYKKYNIRFRISGVDYWLSEKLFNNIKIKCKGKIDVGDLSFSMQEFMNQDVIEKGDYKIHLEHLQHIKNSKADVYLICSKNSKEAYVNIISKLEEKLLEFGLSFKNIYYLSETFYNRDKDEVVSNKIKILIQHLIGYKTEGDKFSDVVINRYDNVYFYEDDINTIASVNDVNNIIKFLIKDTDEEIVESVKGIIRNEEPILILKQVTFNKSNLFLRTEIPIRWLSVIMKFESFKYR